MCCSLMQRPGISDKALVRYGLKGQSEVVLLHFFSVDAHDISDGSALLLGLCVQMCPRMHIFAHLPRGSPSACRLGTSERRNWAGSFPAPSSSTYVTTAKTRPAHVQALSSLPPLDGRPIAARLQQLFGSLAGHDSLVQ